MITKKKVGRLTKFGRTIHSKKCDYSSVKRLLKKFRETGSTDRRNGLGQPRTVSTEEKMDLTGRTAPYAFSNKKNHRTSRNQSVIDTENGEKNTLNSSSA